MGKLSLRNWQIRVFILCWCAYAGIYLGRNNLSIAIPDIQSFLGADKSQIGLIGGMFLWVYGIGQLVNGYIGDKVSARIYIFIGLFVTALANIFFGFAASLSVMCILWVINSFFQSMLWGPISKTVTQWISPEKRSFAAVFISTTGVGGTLITFLLAGQALDKLNWKWVFIYLISIRQISMQMFPIILAFNLLVIICMGVGRIVFTYYYSKKHH